MQRLKAWRAQPQTSFQPFGFHCLHEAAKLATTCVGVHLPDCMYLYITTSANHAGVLTSGPYCFHALFQREKVILIRDHVFARNSERSSVLKSPIFLVSSSSTALTSTNRQLYHFRNEPVMRFSPLQTGYSYWMDFRDSRSGYVFRF